MARRSAGLLLYRRRGGSIEVLLAHPGGPFWARRDAHAWSIPKGEYPEGEDPLDAARREFAEEIGAVPPGPFIPLSPVRQPGGKIVHTWAVCAEFDPADLHSNVFQMEWPPRSGRMQSFPEVDRAEWFALSIAREKLHKGQIAILDELERRLGSPT